MKNKEELKRFFTTGDVARYCQINVNTVKRWIRNGTLKAFQTPSGHFRVVREDFVQFLQRYGYPLDPQIVGNPGAALDILIIDDDPGFLQLMVHLFHTLNEKTTVATASNGAEGFKLVAQLKPRLVLLDLKMPDIAGADLARMIRSQSDMAETRIGIVSAFLNPEIHQSLQRLPVEGIFTKPVERDQLEGLYHHVFGTA
jgi:excisionase family DNA binding protein